MYRHHDRRDDQAADQAAARQTANLVGVAIILLLLVGGLFLVQHLHRSAMFEDCLLAGRRDCDTMMIRHP